MTMTDIPWLYLGTGAMIWHVIFGLMFIVYAVSEGILRNTAWKEKLLLVSMIVIWPSYVFFSLSSDSATWNDNW